MHDGIAFEKQGVPTAVVCTEPFESSAKAMAKICGIPDYPFILLPHPLGGLAAEALQDCAAQAVSEVTRILLCSNSEGY